MSMPTDLPIVDTFMNIPQPGVSKAGRYAHLRRQLRDPEGGTEFPAEYMFKNNPKWDPESPDFDPVEFVVSAMDRAGIAQAVLLADPERPDYDTTAGRAMTEHPGRFALGVANIDPHNVMEARAKIERVVTSHDARLIQFFPSGESPVVPIGDPKMYALYAKCVELDVPVAVCAGVPGPRLPMMPQHVEQIDQVCYDFPDLVFITRHGCEPWTALMVKLLLKWPNLYYSTSAFAPKYYPSDIVEFANTRGADKIIYAGYFPDGLSLDRIMEEMPEVGFRDHVWPKFLHENARRLLRIPLPQIPH